MTYGIVPCLDNEPCSHVNEPGDVASQSSCANYMMLVILFAYKLTVTIESSAWLSPLRVLGHTSVPLPLMLLVLQIMIASFRCPENINLSG